MRELKAKVQSGRGASVVLALLFFLVCLMAGGIILTSATANAGRLTHLRDDQQDYFLLSSAASLLRDDLSGAVYGITVTQTEGSEAQSEYPDLESGELEPKLKNVRLQKSLDEWVKAVYAGTLDEGTAKPFQIAYKDQIVYGTLYIFGKNAPNRYSIEAYFDLAGEGNASASPDRTHYRMRLYIPAEVREQHESYSRPDTEGGEKKTNVTTIRIVWGDGLISRAKEAPSEKAGA